VRDALRTVAQATVAVLGTQQIRTLAMETYCQMKQMQVCTGNDPSSDSGSPLALVRKQVGIGGISAS
jgi:hypothetical protein